MHEEKYFFRAQQFIELLGQLHLFCYQLHSLKLLLFLGINFKNSRIQAATKIHFNKITQSVANYTWPWLDCHYRANSFNQIKSDSFVLAIDGLGACDLL